MSSISLTPHASVQRIALGTLDFRRLAVALVIAGFATFALLYSAQPLLPLFAAEYALSPAQASLAVSFATGAMALAFIPASIISDRIGRRSVMVAALFASAVLTLLTAWLPGWRTLLLMRALTGVALAGIPSIAMTYVAEECDGVSIGSAMGLYIGGSAIGGMAGRLGVTALSEWLGWRSSLTALGGLSLIGAAVFLIAAPASKAFSPQRHNFRSWMTAAVRLMADGALPWLNLEGFLLMGAFVTIYNYIAFRLLAAPFNLSQTQVGLIFLLYILGSVSSAYAGSLAGRIGRRKIFWAPIAVLGVGVAFTAARPLALIVVGVGVVTVGFFAAHSIASGWVGQRAARDKALATSLYLLCYYAGSSVLGSVGGLAWAHGGWRGVALFAGALTFGAFIVSLQLAAVRPLAQTSGA